MRKMFLVLGFGGLKRGALTNNRVKSLFRADVMSSSLLVGTPGMRFIRRPARGDEGRLAGIGSADTAAMASSSVMRKLSFSTAVNWDAVMHSKKGTVIICN